MDKETSMSITKLNKILHQFRQNTNPYNYKFGLCSEFAVALKRYLHAGQLYKSGIMHTCLKYKDHYCDINGCFTYSKYRTISPSVSLSPATKYEIHHIYNLLDNQAVQSILKTLKQSSKQIQ